VSVREIRAPRGASSGMVLGFAIGLLLFVGLLAYETQHLATLARYVTWLGEPLIARIYNPFAVLWWLPKIDPAQFALFPMQHFRPAVPAVHRLVLDISLIAPPRSAPAGDTDIAFAASAVEADGAISLYYSIADKDMLRAIVRR